MRGLLLLAASSTAVNRPVLRGSEHATVKCRGGWSPGSEGGLGNKASAARPLGRDRPGMVSLE